MNKSIALGILIALTAITASSSLFIVREYEQALVFQFGEIVRSETEPGLKWKIPLIQNVTYIDARLLPMETARLELPLATTEREEIVESIAVEGDEDAELLVEAIQAQIGERVEVQAFARFRITDPVRFYERYGVEDLARRNLQSPLQNTIRTTLAKLELEDVLANRRLPISSYGFTGIDLPAAYRDLLIARASTDAERAEIEAGNYPNPSVTDIIAAVVNQGDNVRDAGIWIRDVRFFNLNLPDANRDAIFRRMITERQSLAEQLRAEGRARALEIRANAEKERDVLLAEAQAESERIRGRGDRTAIGIYGDAFGQDEEFYAFYRSLHAYRESMGNGGTMMLLSPESEFFRYFHSLPGQR